MTASETDTPPQACPKCGYVRQASDTGPQAECPHCGVIYAKYLEHQFQFALSSKIAIAPEIAADQPDERAPLWLRIRAALWHTPDRINSLTLYGNAAVLIGTVIWGLWFILQPIDGDTVGASFLHHVDLPFHEFGHVLFRPFGTWLMFLGGSLFQCLLPLILLVYFLDWQSQPFSASICLWWCGQNFIDLAPYIGDARAMALPLTGEWSDEAVEMRDLRHDWHNILAPLHALPYDHVLAGLSKFIGTSLMVLAWTWGGMLLLKQWRKLER